MQSYTGLLLLLRIRNLVQRCSLLVVNIVEVAAWLDLRTQLDSRVFCYDNNNNNFVS